MSGPVDLSVFDLVLAAALLVINAGLSIWLGLGLERKLLVAALRASVQLSLLGLVLAPIFAWSHPAPTLLVGLTMIALAAREAVSRLKRRYRHVTSVSLLTLLIAGGGTALLATTVVLRIDHWWTPRYLVPLLGMILGNALTGVGLGLDRFLASLEEQRGRVEAMLALGATRWEAARPLVSEAIRTGLLPILNSMSVVGLVTIPGMMTGQILGGSDPGLAARYQLMILFLIAGATAMGTAGTVLASARLMFDEGHRLRLDRLLPPRGGGGSRRS